MEYIGRSRANRIPLDKAAAQRLSGDFYLEFKKFYDFLKQEKINTPWKIMDSCNMKYEGRIIGGITLLGGEWEDDVTESRNNLRIGVATADGNGYDKYLEGQPQEVIDLFMDRINNKCSQCRPSSSCAKGKGINITVSGKRHKNICCLSNGFLFNSVDGNITEMVMIKHGGTPQMEMPILPLDTVKALIIAARGYIGKVYPAH